MKTGRDAFKRSLEVGSIARSVIELEIRNNKKLHLKAKGPRAVFMDKYKKCKNIEEAKRALIDNRYKIEAFSNPKKNITADDTFESWIIEEERNGNGR